MYLQRIQTKKISFLLPDVPQKIKLTEETAFLFYEKPKNSTLDIETALIKKEVTAPYENMIIKEIAYTIIKYKFQITYFKIVIFRNNCIQKISIGATTCYMEIPTQGK